MVMRYFFLFLLLLQVVGLYGQSGNYFLSHYSPSKDQFDNVCFDMVQNENGLVYFATRSGIMEFDGLNWDLIAGEGAIYSLQRSASGEIFWAGASGYGKIGYDEQGIRQIQTLSENVKNVFQSIAVNEKLFFLTERSLSILSTGQAPVTVSSNDVTGTFGSIFELFGTVYVNTEQGGVLKVEGDKLVRATFAFPAKDEVIFSRAIQNQYLIGLSSNRVFLCGEDRKLREVNLEDKNYADASVIVNGAWVNSNLFVLGTLRGGMIFVQASTGKTQEIINYATGLPDNEVFTLMSDKSQCIWAAHEYGFTRVAPYLPFRSFSHYPGLQGNLICAVSFQDDVYVGTSLGLFRLEREDFYEEIVSYVDVEVKAKQQKVDPKINKEPEPVSNSPEDQSKRGGFFRFLRRNRSKADEPAKEESTATVKKPVSTEKLKQVKPTYRKVKKTEKVLRTSQYVYKKVQGLEAKINHLLVVNDKLIAAGLAGVYEIEGLAAKPVLQEPTRFVFASENRLFVSTYRDKVTVLRSEAQGWKSLGLLNDLDDQISYIFEGPNDETWFCALDKIYRLERSGDTDSVAGTVHAINIKNPNFDDFVGVRWQDEIVLVNSLGFFHYERNKNTFTTIDSLSLLGLSNYYPVENSIWYRDTHNWNVFGDAQRTRRQSNLRLLNLFSSLRFVSSDPDSENFWIITGDNELFRFFGERFTPYEAGYPVVLKGVWNDNKKTADRGKLKFDQEKSSLTLKVVQPNYLASQAIEYRYQLVGLDENWTDWSTNNATINFPYLPSGDYTLKVQARDIFGRVQNMQAVSFKVLPPYWQRPWFYALEFAFFASLVLLSFRLSTRYRIISRILSLLTIIMLIQFIQTVVGETFATRASPVTDFFVQVFIAFLILPVEGYLRNLMLRSLDSHSGLYKFLTPKPQEQQEP